MGYQIIKQPSGQFAIFSTYTDTIIVWDATREEIIDWFVEIETTRTRQLVGDLIGHVAADQPRKAYFQFAMTWDEALEQDRQHDGVAWRHDLDQLHQQGN